MKIHEYQAKELLKAYKTRTTEFIMVDNHSQIRAAVEKIGVPCVIKAQVHSGARGKNGGVKLCQEKQEAIDTASSILGMDFTSNQLAGETKKVNKIIIEKALNIEKEYYLSLTVDRKVQKIAVIFSKNGGTDIEEVAKTAPDSIVTIHIDTEKPINTAQIVEKIDIESVEKFQLAIILQKLIKLFIEKDCSLIEINPLVVTNERGLVAVDAKINFDDNALFRQPDILALQDADEYKSLEKEAAKYNLSYIKLDGTIGCMVNGAGLAMATMDVIKLAGKSPANFLDVGGGAAAEKIEHAFEILLCDTAVKAIFINIFGGILRCDELAKGVKNAAEKHNPNIPIIIRLEGTNKEEGAKILNSSNLKFQVVKNLDEAADLIRNL